jgi:hypothetical protein
MLGKKGFITSKIALIKHRLYNKDVDAENYIKRNQILHDQADTLRKRKREEDIERKKLLEEILL